MRNPNRYEAILHLRQRAEDTQAQVVARVRQRIQLAGRERTSLELTRQAALDKAGTSLQGHFDASDIRSFYQYERHLAGLRDQKDAEIRVLQNEEAAELKILEKATQDRRIVEKMHERRREAFRAHVVKEEQKSLDEIASNYTARAARLQDVARERGKDT